MKKLLILQFLLILLMTSISVGYGREYGPYQGKVVDKETGAPVIGAVVVTRVLSDKPAPYTLDTTVAAISEVITDEYGEFYVPAHSVKKPTPISTLRQEEEVYIYKPGYIYYPASGTEPLLRPHGTLPRNQFVTIKIPKQSTTGEKIDFPFFGKEEMCLYVLSQLLDQDRIASGYTPYHIHNYWNKKGLVSGWEKTILDRLTRWTYMHIRPSTFAVGKGFSGNRPSIAYSEKHPKTDEWYVWYYHPKEYAEFINELEQEGVSYQLGERKSSNVETVSNIPEDAIMFTKDEKERIDTIVEKFKKRGRLLFLNEEYKDMFVQLLDESEISYIVRTFPDIRGYDIIWREEYNQQVEVIKATLFGKILDSLDQEKDSKRCMDIPCHHNTIVADFLSS